MSNSARDGQTIASCPPQQISSANANSPQIPQRSIVKPHGNCLSSGMVVVRMGCPFRGGPNPDGYAGWGQCADRCRARGAEPIHTVANSLRRGMFRLGPNNEGSRAKAARTSLQITNGAARNQSSPKGLLHCNSRGNQCRTK
jgi:hypothetical protein